MHASLIIGNKDLSVKIDELVNDNSEVINMKVQKIDDVRNLHDITKFQSENKKYLVLHNFDGATAEAMNAFLKLLEEPGKNINFILCADSKKNILDTILSRCNIYNLGFIAGEDSQPKFQTFLKSKLSEKLTIMHGITSKEEASTFLTQIIEGGHQLLVNNGNNKSIHQIIEEAIKSKSELENNVNVTITMTKFTLHLVRID